MELDVAESIEAGPGLATSRRAAVRPKRRSSWLFRLSRGGYRETADAIIGPERSRAKPLLLEGSASIVARSLKSRDRHPAARMQMHGGLAIIQPRRLDPRPAPMPGLSPDRPPTIGDMP